jgi:hypothetical protein
MMLGTLRSMCALLTTVGLLVLGTTRPAAADWITLEWDPNSESVGYRVHVGEQPGTYTQHYDVGPATLFTFQNATPGQRYCFAVSAYLLSSLEEGPSSGEVCGYSNMPPTLLNPGNQASTVGQAVTLQLQGSDPEAQPLSYSATGLPPGLSLMASTGFISGSGTAAGTFSVTAQAFDGTLTASQTFTWTMTAPAGDTTQPTVSIASPTTGTTYSTTSSTITLGGTAADNVGVVQVRWATDGGSSGVASGTTSWSATSIPLVAGSNVITVVAEDAAGNQATDTLTVSYSAPTTTVTLTADTRKGMKWRSTRLAWSNAPWSSVDVYRNGMLLTNTPNDGAHTDPIWSKGTYKYQICAQGSTTACSNTASVFF